MISENYMADVKVLSNYMMKKDKLKKSDVVICCGCADVHVAEYACKLFLNSYADYIIFTGSSGKLSSKIFDKSEAEKFAEIALSLGIPQNRILIENKSTNTGDNLRFSKQIMDSNNINYNNIIITGGVLHGMRFYAAAKTIFKDSNIIISTYDVDIKSFFEFYEKLGVSEYENICILVSDIYKMITYPDKGWQIKVDIPKKVINSYKNLIKLGYDKYMKEIKI